MYTAFPISLRAGQVGVLTFSAGSGSSLGAIEGALYESDPEAPDAPLPQPTPCVVQGNVLYIPALPVGLHLFEVRVGGRTAVYQHVEVQPSPLGETPGSAAWEVQVQDVGGEWHFTISTPVGPAGAPGKSAYEIWLEAGHIGSEADFLASLQGAAGRDGKSPSAEDVAAQLIPRISAELTNEGPAATNNWHASYFMLGENYLPEGTALSEFGYRVRFDSLNGCTTDPVYIGIWELAENGVDWEMRGVSTNTQVQALSSDVLWRFDPAKVRLSGRPIRCCLMETPEDGWRTDLTMGMRVSSATGANTAIFYNDQSWASVPKFFLRGYKPVENITMSGGAWEDMTEHVADKTVHISEEERKKWEKAADDADYAKQKVDAPRVKSGCISCAIGNNAGAQDGGFAFGQAAFAANGVTTIAASPAYGSVPESFLSIVCRSTTDPEHVRSLQGEAAIYYDSQIIDDKGEMDFVRGYITFRELDKLREIAQNTALPDVGNPANSAFVREIAAEEVEKALYDSVPGELILAAEASDNINCVSIELDPIHTPTGRVSAIRLLARDSGAVSGESVYLSAWEQVSGEDYKLLAVSTNTQVQKTGQWGVWTFENLRLSGKRMRYAALLTPSTPFAQASILCLRCAPRPEGDTSLIHSSASPFAYLPAMAIVTASGNAVFAPAAHPQDTVAHLNEEEHKRLTELLKNGVSSGGGGGGDSDHAGDGAGSVQIGAGGSAEGEGSVVIGRGAKDTDLTNTRNNWQVIIGDGARGGGHGNVTIGSYSSTGGDYAVAIGASAVASGDFTAALGYRAIACGRGSTALGERARTLHDGCLALAAGIPTPQETYEECNTSTHLFLIAKDSPLAKKYTNGEAALGYIVVYDAWRVSDDPTRVPTYHILASGTRKLRELLTDNPMAFDPFKTI